MNDVREFPFGVVPSVLNRHICVECEHCVESKFNYYCDVSGMGRREFNRVTGHETNLMGVCAELRTEDTCKAFEPKLEE